MAAKLPNAAVVHMINGDHFMGNLEGEDLTHEPKNGYMVPVRMHGATVPFEKVDMKEADVEVFLRDQVKLLLYEGLEKKEAAVCAYLRLLGFSDGLISDRFNPDAHHLRYNNADVIADDDGLAEYATDNGDVANLYTDAAADEALAELSEDEVNQLAKGFVNMVCMVAFFFRVRGHHYTDELEIRYNNLWNRCRMEGYAQPVSAKFWATYGLHAIMPDVLDAAWDKYNSEGKSAGALVKRFDCAAAGMAGIVVVKAGIDDLQMVANGIRNKVGPAMKYLDEMAAKLQANRWHGSINASYYGAPHDKIDEKRLAAVASAVASVLANIAPESDLNKSAALKRIARGAPITGAILGRAAARIGDSPTLVHALTGEEVVVAGEG